ncbi:rod shape-determining protein RodA [Chlorobaculum limnaeum]|uniref:Peptidoglycan glycosyltransferase RodA n=1 Tax=Chlorobaculum limnaeum TaxID=274537 RepID=A0A1D8D4X6_CHLLM|nr:rod shape-determining protein RodA [Chlorobaculum limnaeum]AOS82908.1 rod shape-determining protein RodA [Chlorobaculum limnaeum]
MEKYNKFDLLWLLAPTAGLILMGLLAVYSATNGSSESVSLFYKQLSWAVAGIMAASIMYYMDYRFVKDNAYFIYAAGLLLLVVVLVFGKKIAGQTSWVRIGMFSFQPSELTKMFTIIAMARFLSDDQTDIGNMMDLGKVLAMALVPAGLIMLQPDMGTTLTCLSFIVPMIVLAGFDLYYIMLAVVPLALMLAGFFNFTILVTLAVISLIMFVLLRKKFFFHQLMITGGGFLCGLLTWKFTSVILKPHQIKRIQIFLDPTADPQGAGYNALQAKIAIASGGIFGKGFLQGTQTQLRYIPAQWTDFIFCVVAEELGFLGSTLLLLLFLALALRLIWMVGAIKNRFVELMLAGYASLLLTHVVINIGMTIGVMPVIGVPLPFISYGGSSLVANMMMVGLAMNFSKNRRHIGY